MFTKNLPLGLVEAQVFIDAASRTLRPGGTLIMTRNTGLNIGSESFTKLSGIKELFEGYSDQLQEDGQFTDLEVERLTGNIKPPFNQSKRTISMLMLTATRR